MNISKKFAFNTGSYIKRDASKDLAYQNSSLPTTKNFAPNTVSYIKKDACEDWEN